MVTEACSLTIPANSRPEFTESGTFDLGVAQFYFLRLVFSSTCFESSEQSARIVAGYSALLISRVDKGAGSLLTFLQFAFIALVHLPRHMVITRTGTYDPTIVRVELSNHVFACAHFRLATLSPHRVVN